MRTQSECNARKEKKEKEKEKKENNTEIAAAQPNEYQESISFLKNISEHIFDPVIEIPDYAV